MAYLGRYAFHDWAQRRDGFEVPYRMYRKKACLSSLYVGRLDQEILSHPPNITAILWLVRWVYAFHSWAQPRDRVEVPDGD